MLFLGIDPGQTGAAVAITKAGQLAGVCPAAFVRGSLSEDVFVWLLNVVKTGVTAAAIEAPISFFGGAGVPKSSMAVAMSAGQWVGLLAAAGIRGVRTVAPRSWQAKVLGNFPRGSKGASKTASCRWAAMVHRDAMADAIRRHGDGVADAAGIAEWLRMEHASDFERMVDELTWKGSGTPGATNL